MNISTFLHKSYNILIVGALSLLFVACAQTNNNNNSVSQPLVSSVNEQENTFIFVTHRSGETQVPVNPQNVVVFDMGILDTMYYLGLEDRVVGIPKSTVPPHLTYFYSDNYADFGTLHEPNFEALIQYDIDLIIISGRARPSFDELSLIAPTIDLGLEVGNQMATFMSNTRYIGLIFDLEEEVENHLSLISEEVLYINNLAYEADLNGLIVLYNSGALSAFGASGRFGLIHDYLGIPTADTEVEVINHGMSISYEYIVNVNPDILFVINRNYAVGEETINLTDFEDNELIRLTNAYQNNNINYLNSWVWYIAPGGITGIQEQIWGVRQALESAM